MLPIRKTEGLRLGRISTHGARYFSTWCTRKRRRGLENPEIIKRFRVALESCVTASDLILGCANVMPDHIHVLFELGSRLTLDRTISKMKGGVSGALKSHELAWQANFFEHRLRPDESLENFALYIFMNPYRAGLVSFDEAWPGWIPGTLCRFEFEEKLRPGGLPWPEWLEVVRGIEIQLGRNIRGDRGADAASAS